MVVHYPPSKIIRVLCFITLFLIAAHGLGLLSTYYFGKPFVKGLVPLFNLDDERNIPSLYSTLLLLSCAGLLFLISSAYAREQVRFSNYWLGLSLIFVFLAMDEAAALHERAMLSLRSTLNATGVWYYAWVIPYAVLVLLFVLAYLRFLLHLPPRLRNLFILSGTIYISGALGMEMLGGYYESAIGTKNLTHALLATAEETMEMAGLLLFLQALMSHLDKAFSPIYVGIAFRERLTAGGTLLSVAQRPYY